MAEMKVHIPAGELEKITRERLEGWGTKLLWNSATPMVLLGIGQNEHAGQTVLIVTDDLPIEYVRDAVRLLYQTLVLDGFKF